ncbi:MAG: hemerythrin domain-containing protein [Calditrichaeota bacterium]|nr:MAG: hemerythrin domain-containing protein [Calditrichota bacterium]
MKRSYALEALSWEHHNGLVLAFRLERGLQMGSEIEEVKKYLLHVWQTALRSHFQVEEDYLATQIKNEPVYNDFSRMRAEHQDFYRLISAIDSCADKEELRSLIKEFSTKLKEHIRFEEREFFTRFENTLTEQEMNSLGQKLHALHKPVDLSWPVEFWKNEDQQ